MFAPRNSSPVAMYGKEEVAAYEVKHGFFIIFFKF